MIEWSKPVRFLVISTLLSATFATIVVSAFVMWPVFQKHRAVSKLIDAIRQQSDTLEGRRTISDCAKAVDAVEASGLAVSALTELVHDEDTEVRKRAVGYILRWSAEVPQALPIIVAALKSADDAVVESVVQDIKAFRLVSSIPLPDWDDWSTSRSSDSRLFGLKLLLRSHWITSREGPMLVEALRDEDTIRDQLVAAYDSHEAIWLASDLIPLLEQATRDTDAQIRKTAAHALQQIRPIGALNAKDR